MEKVEVMKSPTENFLKQNDILVAQDNVQTFRGIKIGKKQKGRVLWSEIKSKDADP